MLAKTLSCGLTGVSGYPVEVEAFISNGMVGFEIVGLPSAAVKESRDRIRAAISVSGYSFPFGKVTVNLAPADVRKEGTAYELAIAIALLSAKEPESFHGLNDTMLLGELSLQGKLLPCAALLAWRLRRRSTACGSSFYPARMPASANALKIWRFIRRIPYGMWLCT